MTVNYPKQRSDLRVRVVGSEKVILDRQEGLIHQLNQTASYIWDRCDGKSSTDEIANQLTKVFEIESAIAAKDVAEIVRQLAKFNLLELPGR